ncbi:MAG: sulfur carrier protein ThiS [Acidimicrobiales bacterium]
MTRQGVPPDDPGAPGSRPPGDPGAARGSRPPAPPASPGAPPFVEVSLNGRPEQVGAGTTVGALVARLLSDPRGVAVAVDEEVVPRSRWDTTELTGNERVEVLTAAQGG